MLICVPLKEGKISKLLSNFELAQNLCDLTEIWFDQLKINSACLAQIKAKKKKPIIYKHENGNETASSIFDMVDYVDLDLSTPTTLIGKLRRKYPKLKIIISSHNFKKTPTTDELKKLSESIIKKKPDILKIACQANSPADSLRMLALCQTLAKGKTKAICLCMGEYGVLTRTAGHIFGNYLTYAPLSQNSKTAPGQIAVRELKQLIT